jgi:pimeloyl-ACP methyl ester carboxylesterase
MKTTPYHPFVSARAKERYLARYDARAGAWPVTGENRTVETAYGPTFVRISGTSGAPPLVLLPSTSATSLFWAPNIEALSSEFRVYAVDNVYDFGRSVYTRPFENTDDIVSWLDSLFDALELTGGINLMGLSYGAWMTCQYALHKGARLSKAVMLAPPATVFPLPGAWAWYGILALIPHRYFLRNMTRWMFPDLMGREDEKSQKIVDDLIEDAFIGMRCYKLKMPVTPTVLTDEELKSIKVPALFLVGEHEKLYSAQKAVERLESTVPGIKTEIIPGAGHDLTIIQADLVDRKVLEYLKQVKA